MQSKLLPISLDYNLRDQGTATVTCYDNYNSVRSTSSFTISDSTIKASTPHTTGTVSTSTRYRTEPQTSVPVNDNLTTPGNGSSSCKPIGHTEDRPDTNGDNSKTNAGKPWFCFSHIILDIQSSLSFFQ